jgi:hypothetical protein
MSDLVATELVGGTEREIFNHGVARDEDELNELDAREEDDGDDTLELPESWDGTPVEIDELAHIAEHGFPDTNFDRPLQLAESERYEAALRQRDEQIATLRQQNTAQAAALDPGRQAREAQQREDVIGSMYADPERVLAYTGALKMENDALRSNYVNESLARAHEKYGVDFERAYANLTDGQDARHPAARNTVSSIYYSDDAGEALMQWDQWNGGRAPPAIMGGRSSSQGRMPPSLNSQSRGYGSTASRSSGRSQRSADTDWPVGEGSDGFGFGNEAVEKDIMNSVWR